MGLKKYFKGKTGVIFWVNVALALGLLFCIPVIAFNTLDSYTHHGEKVSVPSVVGKTFYEASQTLANSGFEAVITDSTYKKTAKPGAVLEQTPKSGTLMKSGRIVYLTVNMKGEPMVKMPDLVGNSSFREAEIILKSMGFKLTEPQYIEGADKDQILKIRQGNRDVHAGESISRERSLTLFVGAGEIEEDSLYFDDSSEDYDIDTDISESNFDEQL